MTTLEEKLRDAEAKQRALLAELNETESALSKLTPADPQRAELKARKADILPRYRGAKEHVKELRRQVTAGVEVAVAGDNSSPTISVQRELLRRLYHAVADITDRFVESDDGATHIEEEETIVFGEFLGLMDEHFGENDD